MSSGGGAPGVACDVVMAISYQKQESDLIQCCEQFCRGERYSAPLHMYVNRDSAGFSNAKRSPAESMSCDESRPNSVSQKASGKCLRAAGS